MLTASVKNLRDPLALGLLGVAALDLLTALSVLLNSDLGEFSTRAVMTQANFVSPVLVVMTVAAAVLVASSEPTPMARLVAMGALVLQGVMLLFGAITWLAGLFWDPEAPLGTVTAEMLAVAGTGFGGMEGAGKLVGTVRMIAYVGFLGMGAFVTRNIFRGLPPMLRPPQWGGPSQPQQWGPPQLPPQPPAPPPQQWQQQWGQPPQPEDQQQDQQREGEDGRPG